MRKSLVAASLVLAASLLVGCVDQPQSVRRVDQSVLPASAKAMFSQDANITSVDELTYSKGVKVYRINYTAGGKNKAVMYNAKDETTPTGVFEHAVH